MAPPDERFPATLRQALRLANEFSAGCAREDGHWCGEVKDNAGMTCEYLSLLFALDVPVPDPNSWIAWILPQQHDDGGWGLAPSLPSTLSTSIEVYFALKLLGVPADNKVMGRCREFIISSGGIGKARMFTRMYLATFGLFPWSSVPELPPELVLIPNWVPLSLYHASWWARQLATSFSLLRHHRPCFQPAVMKEYGEAYLDELWCDPIDKTANYAPGMWELFRSDFTTIASTTVDYWLHLVNGLRFSPLNRLARRKCVNWILERQDRCGQWGGIFPATHANVLALVAEGYSTDSAPVRAGLEGLAAFVWTDSAGKRLQSCASPVWDTVLMAIGMMDAGAPGVQLQKAMEWIAVRQHSGRNGDWRVLQPSLPAGGWAFQDDNTWYQDVDDTAVVVMAFVKQDPGWLNRSAVTKALEWILGMQGDDGGWGAFDRNNNKLFFNKVPFSDMNSMCDPSTSDITGRILEAFGLVMQVLETGLYRVPDSLVPRMKQAAVKAIAFLDKEQEAFGGWYGRWGVNYIYGTSNVLCGLDYFTDRPDCDPDILVHSLIRSSSRWLCEIQQADGGWGECLETYEDPSLAGTGTTTVTQTAWALMALIPRLSPTDPVISRAVQFLLERQSTEGVKAGTWEEKAYTGVGFPNHMYMEYEYYTHYFSAMALGRYARLIGAIPG